MWYYLRKFLKLLGGKVMSKMAPRLIFFQYYNRAGLELEEKKKKFKLHYSLPTQMLIEKSFRRNSSKKLGISAVLE